MSDFESLCEAILELDSRDRGRLIPWQGHVARFVELMASIANEGLAGALSNEAEQLPEIFEALNAIGASSLAANVAAFIGDVKAAGAGDENGFDLAAINDDSKLFGEVQKLTSLIESQHQALWDQAEAFARSKGDALELIGRDGRPFVPLRR